MEHLGNLYREEGQCQYDGYAGGQWAVIGKRIRDACIYPYKINVAQYYP